MANRWEPIETVTDFIWEDSKITEDGDCSHETKKRLLFGRKVMINLDSMFKSRDITLPTNVHLVKVVVSPVVMHGCELDYKENWVPKNWCFWTVVLEKTLESPLDTRISNQSILKEISPECSLEGLMLKLKLQYWCEELTHLKRPWYWERLKAGGEGDDRGWNGWMASRTQWTWVRVGSRSWWWTGKPGMLQSLRVAKSWTRLNNWTDCECVLWWKLMVKVNIS